MRQRRQDLTRVVIKASVQSILSHPLGQAEVITAAPVARHLTVYCCRELRPADVAPRSTFHRGNVPAACRASYSSQACAEGW